ncbi:MAG: exodeoxyribonuclease VII large subunit, partial [Polyangiaceae bacterium]
MPTDADQGSLSFDFSAPPAPSAPSARKPPPPEEPRPLTVGELDRAIKGTLDQGFENPVWVEGEVADCRPAASGHLYFALKDEREEASIDVVVYRSSVTQRMRALCADGARVRVRGRPTFWAPRGRLQLVADRLQAAGKGAMLEALERLKARLAAEGLFAQERKRALPGEPRVVGVVTSATGAVIHDVCRVAFRRGGARILLAAAQVQGAGSIESVCRALAALQRVRGVDVIVLGRGGGSADDLATFNEEAVVRAVAGCRVPVVSAVGHDVDVTLVDFVADARAATPSQAAEMVVPDRRSRSELLGRTRLHLARAMRTRLAEDRVSLAHASKLLGDPRLAIAAHQQSLDEREARLAAWARTAVSRRREALTNAQRRLAYVHPRAVVARERAAMSRLTDRLTSLWHASFERRASDVQRATGRLDALSPLKVLARGYAIATRDDGRAVRRGEDVTPGDTIHVRVADARVDARVERIEQADPVEPLEPRGPVGPPAAAHAAPDTKG